MLPGKEPDLGSEDGKGREGMTGLGKFFTGPAESKETKETKESLRRVFRA